MSEQVLVTGGSGYVAAYVIADLLKQGYQVRATLRSLKNDVAARAAVVEAGAVDTNNLTFVVADLMKDSGWAVALANIDYVMHIASPMIVAKDPNDVIGPAKVGTLRVLKFANAAGVKRVVLTGAFGSVGMGRTKEASRHVFTEADWSPVDSKLLSTYYRSKTLAEKAAWDFVNQPTTTIELSVILPVAILGPILGGKATGSNSLLDLMIGGKMPAVPDMWIPVVDVRDIATAHLLAMTTPEAAGERFIISHDSSMSMPILGELLKVQLNDPNLKITTRQMPNWLIRVIAPFSLQMREMVPDLGIERKMSSAKAHNILGWHPQYTIEDTLLESAQSVINK